MLRNERKSCPLVAERTNKGESQSRLRRRIISFNAPRFLRPTTELTVVHTKNKILEHQEERQPPDWAARLRRHRTGTEREARLSGSLRDGSQPSPTSPCCSSARSSKHRR